MNSLLSIQRITFANLETFKVVRLRALQEAPTAFGSTYGYEANFSDQDWRVRIERWSGRMGVGFLAMHHEEPCGIAGALVASPDSREAELVSMWTAPAHRREGVGTLLVSHVVAWARSQELAVLQLMVTHTNSPAMEFYKRLGFAMTGRTKPYPNDPAITEREMALPLSDLIPSNTSKDDD